MTTEELVVAASNVSVIALGERHGIDEHPKAAACLLTKLSDTHRLALAVEQVASGDQGAIDIFRRDHPETVGGLGKALRWWESGWPAWQIYEPLFQAAWTSRSPLYGADSPKPVPAISSGELDEKFGVKVAALIRREWAVVMQEAHCNTLDRARASQLGDQQISRDSSMASVVETASRAGATVLFYAGRSHIRKDLSVPLRLAKGSNLSVLSIALQETHVAGKPVDRRKILDEAKGRYDYVWFVGEAKNGTVCEKLK